jgi:beta-mannosidase
VRLEVTPAADGTFTVKVTAAKLARDVYLTDGADGFFTDNYFDLLPGETATVSFKPSAPTTVQSIRSSLRATTIADTY